MNRPRPARIRVHARDPLLRSQIVERLAGLGDVSIENDDENDDASAGAPLNGAARADVEVDAPADGPLLTPREAEVLRLLSEGLANKEVAARLGFSTHTAKFHVESILRKLNAVNRAEAVQKGIRQGLIGL